KIQQFRSNRNRLLFRGGSGSDLLRHFRKPHLLVGLDYATKALSVLGACRMRSTDSRTSFSFGSSQRRCSPLNLGRSVATSLMASVAYPSDCSADTWFPADCSTPANTANCKLKSNLE